LCIKCDVCGSTKEENGIFHFSGFISIEFNRDIKICGECIEKYGYTQYFIKIPSAHINSKKELHEC